MSDTEVLLLLGGNLGPLEETFARAAALLAERCGRIVAYSRDHWTAPWGFEDHRPFLNRALLLSTGQAPVEVLVHALGIERELGRERDTAARYGPRTIDIDLLMAPGIVVDGPGLTLPHPRLHERAFALAPAADIAPHWVHPVFGRSILQLLNELYGRPA